MFKKICLLLIFGLILVGVAYAADISSFKALNGFQDEGDGVYVLFKSDHDHPDQILAILKYTENDWKDYCANDTKNNYTVYKGENNTYNFVDGSVNEQGTFELIEVDGAKFIIDLSKSNIDNKNNFTETINGIMEFNKLNNVNPIAE